MEKQILHFTVNEQALVVDEPIKISTNKVNYIQANFDLGTNWSGYDSVRAVWFNDFNCISTVLDSLGNCVVPFEVMKRKGNVKVNLVGSISEDDVLTDRLTSYPVVAVIVDCTAQITGANTSPITPSEYEQFVAAVHEDANRAEQSASNAETSAQNASDSATSAHNSAESAHDDKIAIEEAIAEVIQQIEDFEQVQVVVNTLPPTSPATSDFTDGVLTLGIPQGAKGDTGNGIQSIRKTGTSGLVDTYTITFTDGQTTTFTVTNGAKGDTGNGISTIEKTSTVGLVDTYTITYTDGTTTTFTVTNGEKGDKGDTGEVSLQELEDATIVQTLSDTEPYNYRRTNNGNGAGHREYDEIVGASVGWSQLAPNNYSKDADALVPFTSGTTIVAGHKYLIIRKLSASLNVDNYVYARVSGSNKSCFSITGTKTATIKESAYGGTSIGNTSGTDGNIWIYQANGGNAVAVSDLMFIDLTLFNTQIADYVYTLEQSTAGSGVTWLKTHFPKLFDNGYQPFDSGSIQSVSGLVSHDTVGFNQWDEEWEVGMYSTSDGSKQSASTVIRSKNRIKVIPNTVYYKKYASGVGMQVYKYDEDGNYLGYTAYNGYGTFTIDSNTHYISFNLNTAYGTTYKNDICINLSDPSINGQYFPYEKHTYPLDSSVTLRGKYVLDGDKLKAVGDVWSSDGHIERSRVEDSFDGSENWILRGSGDATYFTLGVGANGSVVDRVIVCDKYPQMVVKGSTTYVGINVFNSSAYGSAVVAVRPQNANGMKTAQFKALLEANPITVVYGISSSTTESAPTYDNPQLCDANGTEEYVGSELPVGHNTDYPMTLIDTADGLSNGTYEPRITVANGKKTVTWVSV